MRAARRKIASDGEAQAQCLDRLVRVAKLPSPDLARRFREAQNLAAIATFATAMALFNGAVAAQKLMSAIHRTSGRFFSGHLANLLAGRATEAIRRHGHDLLPTFGVGKEFKPAEWRSIFHQLHAADLIVQDQEDRDRWILTGAGRAVLKGEAPLTLRGEIPLAGGRKAGVLHTLEEIAVAQAEDLVPPSEAFTPVKPGGETAPLTANQNRLLAASRPSVSKSRESKNNRPSSFSTTRF